MQTIVEQGQVLPLRHKVYLRNLGRAEKRKKIVEDLTVQDMKVKIHNPNLNPNPTKNSVALDKDWLDQ